MKIKLILLLALFTLSVMAITACSDNQGTISPNNQNHSDSIATPLEFFEYERTTEYGGGIKLTDYKGSALDVVIPEKIESEPVVEIGKSVFEDCSGITSVTIPNTVIAIGDKAFDNCTDLTNIIIPNSVTEIGSYAFENCSSLTSITIPDSVTKTGYNIFYGCKNLIDINLPILLEFDNLQEAADMISNSTNSAIADASQMSVISVKKIEGIRTGGNLKIIVDNIEITESTDWKYSDIANERVAQKLFDELEDSLTRDCYFYIEVSGYTLSGAAFWYSTEPITSNTVTSVHKYRDFENAYEAEGTPIGVTGNFIPKE